MIMAAIFFDPMVIPVYIAWVMFTRYVFCTAICLFRGRSFPIVYTGLLYFGQLFGAAVKSYVLFRLDRQKWTRQASASAVGIRRPIGERVRAASSSYLHVLTLGWLTVAVLYLTGVV